MKNSSFLFIWENLYFSFIFEEQFSLIQNSSLVISLFQHFKYFTPLSFCLHCWWQEVCYKSYTSFFIGKVLFFCVCVSRFSLWFSVVWTQHARWKFFYYLSHLDSSESLIYGLVSVIIFEKFLAIFTSQIISVLWTEITCFLLLIHTLL